MTHSTHRYVLVLFLIDEVGIALNVAVPSVAPTRAAAAEERSDLLFGVVFETDTTRRGFWNLNGRAVGDTVPLGDSVLSCLINST